MQGADEENAIRSLLARLYDAWARGGGGAYAECFAEKSDYITFNGMLLRGRSENARLRDNLFKGILPGTALSAEIGTLDLHASNVALVHTSGTRRKKSYQTHVLVKSEGHWLIRSSRIRAYNRSVSGSPVGRKSEFAVDEGSAATRMDTLIKAADIIMTTELD